MMRVVLDTNCLLASLSSRSENFCVWQSLHKGQYILCVSNEILAEYEEIIAQKTNTTVAENVINALVDSDYVVFVDPQFHLGLITADPDDNKFVDCAIAANAKYIVTQDHHFDVLKQIDFPHVDVIGLDYFAKTLNIQH